MPRKAAAAEGAEEPAPRRSGRLASQPKPAEAPAPAPAPAKPKSTKGGKKRAADAAEADAEAAGTKKAKAAEGEDAPADADKMDVDAPDAKAADAPAPAPAPDAAPDAAPEPAAAKSSAAAAAAEEEDAAAAPEAPIKLAEIALGDKLPALVLKNEKDEDVDVSTLVDGKKALVLFLVPKADTPGCTTQACGFRDSYPDFEALGVAVYCLSADTPAAQSKWQTKKSLPYPLLSDRKRALIGALGAGAGGKTQRSHFVFGADGALRERRAPVKPADSPRLALEFVKGLAAE